MAATINLFQLGVILITVGASVAAFSANLIVSEEDKQLLNAYRIAKSEGNEATQDMSNAYFNHVIRVCCTILVGLGIVVCGVAWVSGGNW